MELWETALKPKNRLINIKNCGETLKFKNPTQKHLPNRSKQPLNKNRLQLEELKIREHTDKINTSIGNAKISVEDINYDEFEAHPIQSEHSISLCQLEKLQACFSANFKNFKLKIINLFLQHLGRPPSSAQLCILNNLRTNLSTIDDFTTSPFVPSAQPARF